MTHRRSQQRKHKEANQANTQFTHSPHRRIDTGKRLNQKKRTHSEQDRIAIQTMRGTGLQGEVGPTTCTIAIAIVVVGIRPTLRLRTSWPATETEPTITRQAANTATRFLRAKGDNIIRWTKEDQAGPDSAQAGLDSDQAQAAKEAQGPISATADLKDQWVRSASLSRSRSLFPATTAGWATPWARQADHKEALAHSAAREVRRRMGSPSTLRRTRI